MQENISFYRGLYRLFRFLPFTSSFIRMAEAKYTLIFPTEPAKAEKKSVNLVLKGLLAGAAGVFLLIYSGVDVFGILLTLHLIRTCFTELLSAEVFKSKKAFYRELVAFLDSLRHAYYRSGIVSEAVWEAKETAGHMMRIHGNRLYELLNESENSSDAYIYVDECPDRYLKLLATIALRANSNGAGSDSGRPGFIEGISIVKRDLAAELRFMEKKRHIFSGYSLTAALPVAFVPFIKNWGVNVIEGMEGFYLGTAGRMTALLSLLTAFLCYSAIVYLRDGEELIKSPAGRQTGLRKNSFLLKLARRLIVLEGAKAEQVRSMLLMLDAAESLEDFYVRRITDSVVMGLFMLGTAAYENAGKEAGPIWIAVSAAGFFAGYMYSYIVLHIKRSFIKGSMQEEVLRFQTVISAELSVPGITVLSVLELLESFSEVYRISLRRCINDYMTDDIAAVTALKEREYYIPFRHLAECFIMADETGLEAAFAEISSDMSGLRENNELEMQILTEDRGVLGMLLAVIPGMAVLFGYLLIPFLINAVAMFENYTAEAEELLN